MTWGALEQMVDASNLSLRDHAVLRAYTRHVNPPTDQRPYPDNMIVWPSLEAVVDLSRCSQAMVQRAKHELVEQGILELVGNPGRGKTPRYRISAQKIQRDEAVLERQQQRRERRPKGSQPREGTPAKGSQACEPFGPKRSQRCEPEVIPESKSPEDPNFFHGAGESERTPPPSDPKKRTSDQSQMKPKTRTPAPDILELTDELLAWVQDQGLHVDLCWQRERFLQYCRAHAIENRDWLEAFKLWLLEADRRGLSSRHQPGVGLDSVVAQLRASRRAEAPVEWPGDQVPRPSADAEAEPPEWVHERGRTPWHRPCETRHFTFTACPAQPTPMAAD